MKLQFTIGRSSIASAKEFIEQASRSIRCYLAVFGNGSGICSSCSSRFVCTVFRCKGSATLLHIAEFRPSAVGLYITVGDIHRDVTGNRLCRIEATAVKVRDVGIVDLPMYIAVNHLLGGASNFIKAAATDVALSIILLNSCIGSIDTRQIEPLEVASSYRHGDMAGETPSVAMCAITEGLEPSIAS